MKWLLLINTLATREATTRMRAWRSLKASGAAVLRDGVYLLPATPDNREKLAAIEQDIGQADGMAYLLELDDKPEYAFQSYFDRSEDYQRLAQDIHQLQTSEGTLTDGELSKQNKKLQNTFNVISSTDFFPGEARRQTLALLDAWQRLTGKRLAADEPEARPGQLPLLDPADYSGRTWATRQRPWVDRLASAWLIQTFIDPGAQFLWLASPAAFPADALGDVLGFDFDGARFSHIETGQGTLVTFENLMTSFGLDNQPALKRIAQIVHMLDVGGLPVTEAAGLEQLLRGMRNRINDDDALLAAAAQLFNDLYSAFQPETPNHD